MPIYEYQCDCGNKEERLLPMQEYDLPQPCSCGRVMLRIISVPMHTNGTSLRFTKEGKAVQGKDMALDSLNSKSGGFPSRKDGLRDWGTKASAIGLEKPAKTIW